MTTLCRDCASLHDEPAKRCPACRGPRLVRHDEILDLSLAHVDCDAFYAAVEKRDDPSLAARPVIVGGGKRGVVTAACYVARTFGVKSAMPMYRALDACPHAVVIRPDMQKYAAVGRDVRRLMLETTPLVEPLSLDEAFLDLSGTERLHRMRPAQTLALLSLRIERETGITVSTGLSFNKFLAKVASDADKPRGFTVIGRAEAVAYLDPKPVTLLPGVGRAFAEALAREGISTIGDVRRRDARLLGAKFGANGLRLHRLSNGDDKRKVEPRGDAKSISAETTFESDTSNADELSRILWRLCEKVSERAKSAGLGGRTVQLKLKTPAFATITRRQALEGSTQLAGRIFAAAHALLKRERPGLRYRLIGVGLSELVAAASCDEMVLFDEQGARRDAAERAMDTVRGKFGSGAIRKGRAM